MLLRHHVALWDAIDTCDRSGSLDSDIRNATANDFTAFLQLWPNIRTIGLNGGTAYATFAKANRPLLTRSDLRILKLPSTSPANARWRMDDLLRAWSELFA
jgi:hypoxanthine-DNA glycosylase